MSTRQTFKPNNRSSSFYQLINLLTVKPTVQKGFHQKYHSVNISKNHQYSIDSETKITQQDVDNLTNQSQLDISKIENDFIQKRKKSPQPSFLTKSDEVPTTYQSQNASIYLESETAATPHENKKLNKKKQYSMIITQQYFLYLKINKNEYSKFFSPSKIHTNSALQVDYQSKNNNVSVESSTQDIIQSLSIKNQTRRIREECQKKSEQMQTKLNTMLQKSKDKYLNLREELQNKGIFKKDKNPYKLDKQQEPINALFNTDLIAKPSINNQFMQEAKIVQGASFFAKKFTKEDAENFMKKSLVRINNSEELESLKNKEKCNPPIIITREHTFNHKNDQLKQKFFMNNSLKVIDQSQKLSNKSLNLQQNNGKKNKVLTEWFIPDKFKGMIRNELTFEKQYPYVKDSEYLYKNFYNNEQLYPIDPFQSNNNQIKDEIKQEKIKHLLSYRERLGHVPIIMELSKKLKENNQRVPLFISDQSKKN